MVVMDIMLKILAILGEYMTSSCGWASQGSTKEGKSFGFQSSDVPPGNQLSGFSSIKLNIHAISASELAKV